MNLRYAVLTGSGGLAGWHARSIDELERAQNMCVAQLNVPDDIRSRRLHEFLRASGAASQRSADTVPALHGIRVIAVSRRDGEGFQLDDEALADLRMLQLDFILSFIDERVTGSMLDAARLGVWTFRFGDLERPSAAVPAFYEVLRGEHATQAALVRLGRTSDDVLRSGCLATQHQSFPDNLDAICYSAACWPSFVCRSLDRGLGIDRIIRRTVASNEGVAGIPAWRDQRLVSATTAWRSLANRWQGSMTRVMWNVGVVEAPIQSFLQPTEDRKIQWIDPPGSHSFLADPFAILRDGRTTVFAEEYDYHKERGRIVTFDLSPSGRGDLKTAIEESYHLSYPFIVEEGGATFCIPESFEAREIALYEAVRFPDVWHKAATLVADFAGNDSTIIRHAGKWWMFSTDHDLGFASALCVFFADDLHGPWKPHPLNPVKVDVRSACAAGTPFEHDGEIYRPAQDCSKRYGGRIAINRIVRLSEVDFAEEPVAWVEPQGGDYHLGTHTISAVDDRTLVDGYRSGSRPRGAKHLMWGYSRDLFRALGVRRSELHRFRRDRYRTVRVAACIPLDVTRWRELDALHPAPTFTARPAWSIAWAETFPQEPYPIECLLRDGRKFYVPLLRSHGRFGWVSYSAMPWGMWTMVLDEEGHEAPPEVTQSVLEALARHCASLDLRLWPLGRDGEMPLPGRLTWGEISVIDLGAGVESALAAMDGKARRMAGQAARRGVTCSPAQGQDAVDVYYEILEASAKRWGLNKPTIPKTLIENVMKEGGPDAEIWFALHEGNPIAGGIALFGADEMIFWSAAMHGEYSALRPSNALNVALMKRAAERDVRWYNLCSSSGLSGVDRFKATLGAEHVPYATITTEQPAFAAYRTFRRVFGAR